MLYLVNGKTASKKEIVEKGFALSNVIKNGNTSSRNLTANGRESNNNSKIVCFTYSEASSYVETKPVFFKVQGNMCMWMLDR